MPGLILAAINPDNTPHGYNWTFAFPMLLFIIIGGILYILFSRPHRRVPSRPISAAGLRLPDAAAARSASIAGGLSQAPGGGTTESQHEPAGAHLTASAGEDAAENTGENAGADANPEPDEQTSAEGTESSG